MIVDSGQVWDFIREGDMRGLCSYYCNQKGWGPYQRDVAAEKSIAARVTVNVDAGYILDIVDMELVRAAPSQSA